MDGKYITLAAIVAGVALIIFALNGSPSYQSGEDAMGAALRLGLVAVLGICLAAGGVLYFVIRAFLAL